MKNLVNFDLTVPAQCDFIPIIGVQQVEEDESKKWHVVGANDSSNIVTSTQQYGGGMSGSDDTNQGQTGKRQRRVACTCPNCKDGDRYVHRPMNDYTL